MTRKKIFLSIGTIGLSLAIILVLIMVNRPSPIVPQSIQKQVAFIVFYPRPSSQITIQESSFHYAPNLGQVSFIVKFSGRQITFAEQSTPGSFSADPSFYSSFISKLDGYATISSLYGRVDLTRPPQVSGETGVMVAKGTLLFAKSSGNISQNNWTLLFNSLDYTRP